MQPAQEKMAHLNAAWEHRQDFIHAPPASWTLRFDPSSSPTGHQSLSRLLLFCSGCYWQVCVILCAADIIVWFRHKLACCIAQFDRVSPCFPICSMYVSSPQAVDLSCCFPRAVGVMFLAPVRCRFSFFMCSLQVAVPMRVAIAFA